MRIIAGHLRGRYLKTKDNPAVRPISGRIKQSLFDIIAGIVPGSKWLDMFAGTGAVGFEALSRGADFVFFVDLEKANIAQIEANLKKAGLAPKARARVGNALSELAWVSFYAGVSQFDFIFLGPPYKTVEKKALAYSTPALARVCEANLLAPKGWIFSQHHMKEDLVVPEGYEQVRREKYGDTYLDFIRRKAS
jgi:16S rRNA (guanine966-N2)-methyltransferase